jgi:hypothetical protein
VSGRINPVAGLLIGALMNGSENEAVKLFGARAMVDYQIANGATGAMVYGLTRGEFLDQCAAEYDGAVAHVGPAEVADYARRRAEREGR